jgi:microcystin-dependent protein
MYVRGWRIADGTDFTPDLIDSFPKMGTFAQRTGTGGSKSIVASVSNHTLSEAEMPSHNHTIDAGASSGSNAYIGVINRNKSSTRPTNNTGGSNSHNHGFSAGSTANEPQFTYLVPLYFTGVAGTYP